MNQSLSTSSAHTPGPWCVGKSIDGEYIIFGEDRDCYVCACNPDSQNQDANARLIASAPRLLQRLRTLIEELQAMKEMMLNGAEGDSWMVTEDGWRAILDETRAVIAEAEPQQPRFIGDYEPGMVTPAGITVLANCRRRKDAQAAARHHGGRVVPYLNGRYKRGWVVTTRPQCAA